MNWKDYQHNYSEEKSVGVKYRTAMMKDLETFLEKALKDAENERNNFISPKKMAEQQDSYREKFIEMLGFPLTAQLPYGEKVDSVLVREDELASYYRMRIEIFPDFYVYGIFSKVKKEGKTPFVLAQHGMLGTPEMLNGWLTNSSNYNHMVQRIVRQGISVFSTQLYLWSQSYGPSIDREIIDAKLRGVGGSITALETWMLKRVLDYFEKQNYVDEQRMGMIGLSYGGMYTLYTTALDKRIKSAYSSCFFNDRTKCIRPDWSYNNMYKQFTDAEICGLIAPRALFIEVGSKDEVVIAKTSLPISKKAKDYYKEAKAEDKFMFRVFDGGHELCLDDDGIDFLVKHI